MCTLVVALIFWHAFSILINVFYVGGGHWVHLGYPSNNCTKALALVYMVLHTRHDTFGKAIYSDSESNATG